MIVSFSIILLFAITSCTGQVITDKIWDHYNEYLFKIPFNHKNPRMTDAVYFETNYSMEQMIQFIEEAGYSASLHKNGNVRTILITAQKNDAAYYFIIFDKDYLHNIHPNNESYTLKDATLTISTNCKERDSIYVFLAPIHILDTTTNSEIKKVYGSFDDVANFYSLTKKSNVQIDYENKKIYFETQSNPNTNWKQGTLTMQFIETEAYNYLNIKSVQ